MTGAVDGVEVHHVEVASFDSQQSRKRRRDPGGAPVVAVYERSDRRPLQGVARAAGMQCDIVGRALGETPGDLEIVHQITGTPVVLNTGFNDREPIVETTAHALATFQECDLDAVCIDDCPVERD